jgi:hypothetical protein
MMLFLAVTARLVAQPPTAPHGMYCGRNELRFEGDLKGSSVAGAILDPTGVAIPRGPASISTIGV